MTFEKCALACADYNYFGTTNGFGCACGNSIKANSIVTPNECAIPCNGNVRAGRPVDSQMCGGQASSSIYRKRESNSDLRSNLSTMVSSSLLGCYNDGDRSLRAPYPDTGFRMPISRLQSCEAQCAGFKYFGLRNFRVENRNYCICRDDLTDGVQISSDANCDLPCDEDNSRKCASSSIAYVVLYASPELTPCADLETSLRIKNPGFENGIALWSVSSSTGVVQWQAISSTNSHVGQRVARIVAKTGVGSLTLSQTVPVCPGVGYILTFWTYKSNGPCQIKSRFNNVNHDGKVATDGWFMQQMYVSSTVVNTNLEFEMSCSGSSLSSIFIDDLQLRPASIAGCAFSRSSFSVTILDSGGRSS